MWYRVLVLIGLLAAPGMASSQPRRALPASVDLALEFEKLDLPPRAQGERDVCSLFAITALAEFDCARHMPRPHNGLSEEFLIWAGNQASGLKGDQAMFYKAVHGLNTFGICSEELMPYTWKKSVAGPSAAARADARKRAERWQVNWIKRWDVRRKLSDVELHAIKKALADGHPVACGLRWPKALQGHELRAVPPPDGVFDGHSIVLTGYADNQKKTGAGVFLFRNSAGPKWGNKGYGVMSYAYVRTYANDALWLHFGAPKSEVPTERFEAEALPVLARGRCETSPQKMDEWGGLMWSQRKQLFCGAKAGGFVELGFTVRKAGRYRVRVLATAAPDYGTVQAALDGKSLKGKFDLYSGRVCPSGSLELGVHELSAGGHRLRITAVGKDPASTGFAFGLDAIDLMASVPSIFD